MGKQMTTDNAALSVFKFYKTTVAWPDNLLLCGNHNQGENLTVENLDLFMVTWMHNFYISYPTIYESSHQQ